MTEALVIRYAVARLAAYPVVLFNTGIDIREYRNQSDINWMGKKIRDLDPYGHPVSSRHGGGSGIAMSDQTFDSVDNNRAEIDELLDNFDDALVPVSSDDAWGENRGDHLNKDHTPADIRRAFWKCVVAGGIGGLVRGGGDGGDESGFYHIKQVASDLESEQWLKLINPFVQTELGETFGSMVPANSLVSNGYCLADPDRSKLLYVLIGVNDTYDAGDGGAITVKLSGLSGDYAAKWFDPRNGKETKLDDVLEGGSDHSIKPPSEDIVLASIDSLPEASD